MANDNRSINNIYNNGLNDAYGQLPPSQNLLLKTGQTTSYATGDDGDLEIGLDSPAVRFEETNIAGVDLVIDHHTGLMWPKTVIQDVTEMTWYSALTAVNALNLAGFSDWRMPNVLEMMSIIDCESCIPGVPTRLLYDVFTNQSALGYKTWTSTTRVPTQVLIMWHSNATINTRSKNDIYCGWACCRSM